MDKENVICTYSEVLALENRGILPYAIMWMNSEETVKKKTANHRKANTA